MHTDVQPTTPPPPPPKFTPTQLHNNYAGPIVEKFPGDSCAIEGDKGVSFKVCVSGNPRPSIMWYFDDQPIQPDKTLEVQKDGSIFIPITQNKHEGLYKMVAKNSIASLERTFRFHVKTKETRKKPRVQNSNETDVQPITVDTFGEYVANNHVDDDKGFKNQFMVWLLDCK